MSDTTKSFTPGAFSSININTVGCELILGEELTEGKKTNKNTVVLKWSELSQLAFGKIVSYGLKRLINDAAAGGGLTPDERKAGVKITPARRHKCRVDKLEWLREGCPKVGKINSELKGFVKGLKLAGITEDEALTLMKNQPFPEEDIVVTVVAVYED